MVAEHFVIVFIKVQYTTDVTDWYVLEQFKVSVRIWHPTVEVSKRKLQVCCSGDIVEDIFCVFAHGFVMANEVVLDVTGPTVVVLWSPMPVDLIFMRTFPQNVPNKLSKRHILCEFLRTINQSIN